MCGPVVWMNPLSVCIQKIILLKKLVETVLMSMVTFEKSLKIGSNRHNVAVDIPDPLGTGFTCHII